MSYRAPKGTKDVLPDQSYRWQYVEERIRRICSLYGLREIRTPVFEHTELFLRGVGDTTDIVQKEMYTFTDKGERSLTLKPEGTAGVVRSFIEHSLFNDAQPSKMYYLYSPVFRYERPQAGRLREHHQFGVEIFGAPDAHTDAEVIQLALDVLNGVGVRSLDVKINSIGCKKCRPTYNEKLREYFKPHIDSMCAMCKDRYERNPLRLLDCKNEDCAVIAKGAPSMIDNLCEECSEHFEQLKSNLEVLEIGYEIDSTIVRGLDYYTKTVFEIISNQIGSQGTVCGGGRYDDLIESCGGPKMAGIGFGMGMERLLLVMEAQGIVLDEEERYDAFVVTFGDNARALSLCKRLRDMGAKADFDHLGRSMKAQMRYAEKVWTRYTIIQGDEEVEKNMVSLKNMLTGEQQMVSLDEAIAIILCIRGEIYDS